MLWVLPALLLASQDTSPQPTDPPTFARDVAPILYANCAACHHPGEAAPFSLLSYDDARKRARQIVEVTQKGLMPPWQPARGEVHFQGERGLSEAQKATLHDWLAAGAPPGDLDGAPRAPTFTEGWQLGTPDLVLESPPYTLAADGPDVFRNFVVHLPLTEPRWIESIELRPINPRVTHHARLGVDASNESVRRDAEDPAPGYEGMAWGQDPDGQLVIWAPGMIAPPRAPGIAWRLYPQSTLVLHTHMQPSGKPEQVQFRVGVHFAKDAPTLRPAMLRVGSCGIDIPAGARRHMVTDEFVVPVDIDVHTIFPHAHSLCTELHVGAVRPDGGRVPLIDIDHFDENWHDLYRYASPVRLPAGTRITSRFVYDNSDENPRNRSRPARRVGYGSNVTDEMQDTYLQVTPVRPEQREVLMEDYKAYELRAQITGARKSLELDPADTWSQESLATYLVGAGSPGAAIPVLEKRVKSGPRGVFPLVGLGMARLATGDNAAAEVNFRDAITADPQYPLAWLGLGRALVAQNKDGSEDALRRAATLAPGLLEAHLTLADLLIRRGRLAEAAQVCREALRNSPDTASTYLKLAEIAARQLDYDQSLGFCSKAREAAPYTHPPKLLLALFAVNNNDQARAVQLLEQARAEFPEHPMPPLVLAQLAARRQQWIEARGLVEAAARLPFPDTWPASHRRRFTILLQSQRAKIAEALQDKGMARDALEQWSRAEPENTRVRAMLDALSSAR